MQCCISIFEIIPKQLVIFVLNLFVCHVIIGFTHQGLGTDEACLIEIICTRSSSEMKEIVKMYQQRKWTIARLGVSYIISILIPIINSNFNYTSQILIPNPKYQFQF